MVDINVSTEMVTLQEVHVRCVLLVNRKEISHYQRGYIENLGIGPHNGPLTSCQLKCGSLSPAVLEIRHEIVYHSKFYVNGKTYIPLEYISTMPSHESYNQEEVLEAFPLRDGYNLRLPEGAVRVSFSIDSSRIRHVPDYLIRQKVRDVGYFSEKFKDTQNGYERRLDTFTGAGVPLINIWLSQEGLGQVTFIQNIKSHWQRSTSNPLQLLFKTPPVSIRLAWAISRYPMNSKSWHQSCL